MARYNSNEHSSADQSTQMAETIKKWMGNPILRKTLAMCTKRDSCGRRIELVLRDYAGDKQDLCIGCDASKLIVSHVLDYFIEKSGVPKKEVLKNLRDPMWRKGLSSVLEGVAKYGPQKPFTAYVPFLIVWNITRACNLNCRHCYESAHTRAPDELTTAEALAAVDAMADAGVAYIAISGGEPLVRPDLFEIAEHIRKREMAFSIATNGTLLTKKIVRRLQDVGCIYIQISLDGASPKTHNWLRGRDAFSKAVRGIKNATKSNMSVGIACTVTKRNLREVPKLIALTEKWEANVFMHYNFIPTGRGKEIVDLDITPQEREQLLEYLAKETKKRKIHLLSTAPQYARICAALPGVAPSLSHFDTISATDTSENTEFLAEFVGGCGTARLYCALEPNGDIEPCVFIPIKVGNIKKDNLISVWQNDKTMIALRSRNKFKGKCLNCGSRNVCGGCRARAYGYYRDVQQSDPGCINNEEEWRNFVLKTKIVGN